MAQAQDRSDLDIKCVRARPWVRRFVEEYQDGRPWGYALFQDPTVDDDKMEECMGRLDLLLETAQGAVFGRSIEQFPRFQWEYLDWPEGSDNGDHSDGQDDAAASPLEKAVQHRSQPGMDAGDVERVSEGDASEDDDNREDSEDNKDDSEIDIGSEDTDEDLENNDKDASKDEDDSSEDDDEDDADIDFVKDLPILRAHFNWVCHQKKRRKVHESLDVDRSGIPRGLLRNVLILIDEDAAESITGRSSYADSSWAWAIDPNYTGDVVSMTKNGLTDKYYGYMRVRVQQLVYNFWVALHQEGLTLPTLWQAAKQSHNCAFVSLEPDEAQLVGGDMDLGSILRAYPVGHELGPRVVRGPPLQPYGT